MEISATTITVVGVVCVILGIVAGLLINSLTDGSDETAEATDEAPPGGRKGRYTPVFRVWREKGAGTLVVEMDGKAMIAPDPLNEIQRERLERTVRDLRTWLGMGLPAAQVSQPEAAAPAAAPEAAASAPAMPAAMPAALPEDDLSRVIAPVQASPAPKPAAQPGNLHNPVVPPVVVKGKDIPVVVPAAKSIVLQIEDILQDMIAGTPFEQRGVHLMEDPTRGVIVQVGLEHFEGIDAVPDPNIKAIIQSAVHEWEKSQ